MLYLYIICFLIGIGVMVLRKKQEKEQLSPAAPKTEKTDCDHTGCGTTCFCDDEAIQRAASREIVYFEDEELDVFKGRNEDAYDENETEQFSEVLTTLRTDEIADWLHSLQLRGIALPASLKEEVIMLMQE